MKNSEHAVPPDPQDDVIREKITALAEQFLFYIKKELSQTQSEEHTLVIPMVVYLRKNQAPRCTIPESGIRRLKRMSKLIECNEVASRETIRSMITAIRDDRTKYAQQCLEILYTLRDNDNVYMFPEPNQEVYDSAGVRTATIVATLKKLLKKHGFPQYVFWSYDRKINKKYRIYIDPEQKISPHESS